MSKITIYQDSQETSLITDPKSVWRIVWSVTIQLLIYFAQYLECRDGVEYVSKLNAFGISLELFKYFPQGRETVSLFCKGFIMRASYKILHQYRDMFEWVPPPYWKSNSKLISSSSFKAFNFTIKEDLKFNLKLGGWLENL